MPLNDKNKCDHKGKWKGMGITPMTTSKEVILIHSMFCGECGLSRVNTIKVSLPEPPKIVTPGQPKIIPRAH